MQDFEKLGAFYLGKRHDFSSKTTTDELILYDSKDLTTHAVIIGMTGSGKTGLGIGIIEEAAMDHIPVIAIDPKGDMGNLLLTFPKLRSQDFRPWVDQRAAVESGQSEEEFSAATAALWKKGLAKWGQKPARIGNLRAATDMAIYTPGSTAGLPISVLREFRAPPAEVVADEDLYRERVQGTATSLLTLLDVDADPVTSRDHILLANVLDQAWKQGKHLDLAGLIGAIQSPGFDRVGVMDLDTFYPAKDRFGLAMKLNNLLAAPGFEAWMQGPPLDMNELMYTDSGRPRISVMSIAHLDDTERMFFVTMLLSELVAWMRQQKGSPSLRAVLYMDEIFGYMPPVANPPSKKLLLTLLKQARAFGIGVVLSTQNPVDLDYKGLSNTGTWFIGRLQTERDQARVFEGLRGATGSDRLDSGALKNALSGLGKRRFLMHNVHEKSPVMFETRWVMSYMAGPLTRDQIKLLMASKKKELPQESDEPTAARSDNIASTQPVLPPSISQAFLLPQRMPKAGEQMVYTPKLLAAADVGYSNARLNVAASKSMLFIVEPADGVVTVDWDSADFLDSEISDLDTEPAANAAFSKCPSELSQPRNFAEWSKAFKRWVRAEQPLVLYKSSTLRVTSQPEETERDFRIRLQQLGNVERDLQVAKLRQRYEKKVTVLENRLRRAEQVLERESEQARSSKVDTAISFGTAVLGALLGRKRISTATASKVGTAARKAGRLKKESGDVRRAETTVGAVQDELEKLQKKFDQDVDALQDAFDAQTEELKEILVRAKTTELDVKFLGIGWAPHIEDISEST